MTPCNHPSCKPGATVQGVKERAWYCSRPLGHTGNHRHTAAYLQTPAYNLVDNMAHQDRAAVAENAAARRASGIDGPGTDGSERPDD